MGNNFWALNLSLKPLSIGIVYLIVAIFTWGLSTLFGIEYFKGEKHRARYYLFTVITLIGFLGVFFSADYFSIFLFFEIMSLASYVWVAQEETKEALRAAGTYLAISVIGGLSMLMGLMLLYSDNSAQYSDYLIYGLLFFGFAAKAGLFPLHIWLPKAHPVAPAPASALLSGMLTKAGVLGIVSISFFGLTGDLGWGRFILILGLITMLLGAVLAVFSVNLKRTLACSSLSQIGFIVTGIGIGTLSVSGSALSEGAYLARCGVILYMINHSVFKLVLFLCAGAVFMNIHKLDLSEIRGFGRNKTFLKVIFAVAGLGISGMPLLSGYISKTLIHEGIVDSAASLGGWTRPVEMLFLIGGGCTLAYMLKLFIAIFVEKNEDEAVQEEYDKMGKTGYLSPLSRVVLIAGTLPIAVFGLLPHLTMDKIVGFCSPMLFGYEDKVTNIINYFSIDCLKGGLISILIGLVIYFGIIRTCFINNGRYINLWNEKPDLENLIYRPILMTALPFIGTFFARICDRAVDFIILMLRRSFYSEKAIPREYAEGNPLTHVAGEMLDRRYYALRGHDLEPTETYEHRFAMWYYRFSENRNIIARSLSFGLALASLGLLLTLVYLLSFLVL